MRLKRFLLPTLLAVGVLACAAAVLAAGDFGLSAAAGSTIPTGTSIEGFIAKILKAALGLVGTLFLLLMIYAGFTYMTARGDEKKVGEAKKMITGAILGLVIIASAYAVTSFVLTSVTGPASNVTSGTGAGVASCNRSCSACNATTQTCAADPTSGCVACIDNSTAPASCIPDRDANGTITNQDCPSGQTCQGIDPATSVGHCG